LQICRIDISRESVITSDREHTVKERLFTVDEANALIPTLEIIMGKLQRHGLTLREEVGALARETGHLPENLTVPEVVELRPQLHPLVEEMEQLLGEIDAYGLQMKGLDLGLVDFPAEINGEFVLLCWQYGEKEVGYYHSVEAGFAGRQPLDARTTRPKYLQ
jgi:hypothetical protein